MENRIYSSIFSLLPKKCKVFLRKIKLGYRLVFLEKSYLVQTGYINSIIEFSLTNNNKEYIPWMNYPFIDFLKEKLSKDLVVFEYGSGFSTIFFAKRTKEIISIEYDKVWYKKVKETLFNNIDNGQIYLVELDDLYPNSIKKYMKNRTCDIIIIDGRKRVKCAKEAYDYLSEKGVVIFDDSHRKHYQEGIKFYQEKGFKTITFKGLKPTGFGTDQTTLIYRNNNCLGI